MDKIILTEILEKVSINPNRTIQKVWRTNYSLIFGEGVVQQKDQFNINFSLLPYSPERGLLDFYLCSVFICVTYKYRLENKHATSEWVNLISMTV